MTQPAHRLYPIRPDMEPWDRFLRPAARRSALLAAFVTAAANIVIIAGFRLVAGSLPVNLTSPNPWGIDPAVWTVTCLAGSSALLAALVVWTMVRSGSARPRLFNPFHRSGALNLLATTIASVLAYGITSLIWPGSTSLYVALVTWLVLYSTLVPAFMSVRRISPSR